MKRKRLCLLLCCLLAMASLCGCGGEKEEESGSTAPAATEPVSEITVEEAVAQTAAYYYDRASELPVGEAGSDWAVIALIRSDSKVPDGFYDAYDALLEQKITDCGGVLDAAKYTEYSRTVLVLTALGKDPRNVGGYNLLIPLADFDKVCVQGLNGPIWALIALNSGAYELPANPDAATQATAEMYLQKILTSQNEDGSFSLDAGADGDVDITAMALQALAFYNEREDVSPVIEKALNYLSAVQDDDGGYSSWSEPNAESCAQVLTALASLGVSAEDERFVKNGCGVSDALLTYGMGDGSYMHSKSLNTSDPLGTEQAFYAFTAQERAEKGLSPLYAMAE